jgi:hypothetical protein
MLGWYCPFSNQIQIHPVSDLPFTLILKTRLVRSTKTSYHQSSKMLDGQVTANHINLRNVETHLHPYADSAHRLTPHVLTCSTLNRGTGNNGLVLA